MPIIVKGVQSVADVDLCAKAGVEGVVLVSWVAVIKADVSQITVVANATCQSRPSMVSQPADGDV